MALRSPLFRTILLRPSHLRIATKTGSSVRTFFSGFSASTKPQILTASRALPYPSSRLFELIADVDSYSQFVPYCQQSRVTHWTTSLPAGGDSSKKLPIQADLHVGWGAFEEVFTSRLVCDPAAGLVEARSGKDIYTIQQPEQETKPPTSSLAVCAGGSALPVQIGSSGSVFTSLRTRWTVKPLFRPKSTPGNTDKDWSQVDLHITFQFSSPLYAAVSRAVSDKMAGLMIEAFEKQARKRLGPR